MSDSIDADLLDYYQRELTWLRHAGGAFAERYPKVARRLQLAPGECPDPHVERLLEGFSLLTARLQRRLDDDYAEFSDALLEQLYPWRCARCRPARSSSSNRTRPRATSQRATGCRAIPHCSSPPAAATACISAAAPRRPCGRWRSTKRPCSAARKRKP